MNFLRARKARLSIDMAPLIDIVFQLLVFFMLSSSFLMPSLKLDLPQAAEKDPSLSPTLVISMDRDGALFLNARPVAMERLSGELEEALKARPGDAVNIRGDQQMPYGYFVQVMDQARRAGASRINIVHEQESRS